MRKFLLLILLCLFLVVGSADARMVVSLLGGGISLGNYTNDGTYTAGLAWNSHCTFSFDTGSGTSQTMVIVAGVESSEAITATAKWTKSGEGDDNGTQIEYQTVFGSSTYNRVWIWYVDSPTVGSGTVTVTYSSTTDLEGRCGAVMLNGAQSGGASTAHNGNTCSTCSGDPVTAAITTLEDNSYVVQVGSMGQPEITFAQADPWTEILDQSDNNNKGTTTGIMYHQDVSAGSLDCKVDPSGAVNRVAMACAAIRPGS